MMLLAKGLTAAHLPLGAVVLNSHCAGFFDDNPLPTGLTYAGHTLCCAAGVAAVTAYEDEGLVERSRSLGEWMHHRLHEIAARHPSVGDVRDIGLFAALELVADPTTREPSAQWPQVPPSLHRLSREAKSRGVVFGVRGNLLIICPPLIIEEADLAWALDMLNELLVITDEDCRRVDGVYVRLPAPCVPADLCAATGSGAFTTGRRPIAPRSRWLRTDRSERLPCTRITPVCTGVTTWAT